MKQPRNYRADEIQVRKGNYIGDDKSKVELLLYADSRACQEVLDETFGVMGWSCNYKEEKGILFCGIGVHDTDTDVWVWRWNSGAEQSFEKEKSVASDALKRCAVLFGVGRSLYRSPRVIVDNDNRSFKVSEISYEDGKVKDLVIVDRYDNVVYSYHNFKQDGGEYTASSKSQAAKEYPKDIEGVKAFVNDRWEAADADGKHVLSAFYNECNKRQEDLAKYGVMSLWRFIQKDLREGKKELRRVTPQGVDQKPMWVFVKKNSTI